MTEGQAPHPSRSFLRGLAPSALPRDERGAWTTGAGFGLAALALFALTHLGMTLVGAQAGHLRELGPAHALWILPALGVDLLTALALALSIGAALRYLPRARPLTLALAYLALLFTALVCLVSVPTYGALHATLNFTQLLLAGGVRDLWESGIEVVSPAGLAFAVLFILATLLSVPRCERLASGMLTRLAEKRARLLLAAAAVLVLVATLLAPPGGASGLEQNALAGFTLSAARYEVRHLRSVKADMTGAPHFNAQPLQKSPKAEPLAALLATDQLPLKNANVVLFVLESAAVNQLPLWYGDVQNTPRMTELAKHGVVFDQYYTASPVSMKSLFTLHCASYPYPHPSAETYVNPSLECRSISEVLKDQGYRTGLFHSGRFSYTRKDEFFKYRRYDVMRDAKTLEHASRYPSVPWGVDDRAAVDDALSWLGEAPDKPFFLDMVFLAPHHPYVLPRGVPTPYGTKSDLSRYRNATQFIDSQIGRVVDWLSAHGKLDDTLIVIVGDHGEAFGEHAGNFTHGTRIYEESVRTPLLLVNPRLFRGAKSHRIGNHVDLVPTVLDVLGLPAEPRHQGKSLLRGYKPHVIYFYADWYRHYLGLRDGSWKYIYDLDTETEELFDLSKDRHEKRDVARTHDKQLASYQKRVLAWESFYRELIPSYQHYVSSSNACKNQDTCYLDDLKPVLQKGELRKNRSYGGDKLHVGKQSAVRGLGVQPLSILRYDLHGDGWKTLTGGVGHHVQGRNANLSLKVSAEIYLDDKLIWSSGKLSADDEPREFELDVSGGNVLELIGYDVDGETWRDYMDWMNVRLTR